MDSYNRTVVGLDVSDKTAHVCVMDRLSGVLQECVITLDAEQFRTQIPFIAPDHGCIVLETGSRAAWIKREFTALGMRVVVADARKLKAISGSPTKTDRNDARLLAKFGLADELMGPAGQQLLHDTFVRSGEMQHVYTHLTMRDSLVRRRGDLIREVRAAVKGNGSNLKSGGTSDGFYRRRVEVELILGDLADPMFDVIDAVSKAIRTIDARLEALCDLFPAARLLRQIKGVGPVIALAFVATVGDPKRFRKGRDVGAYFGMVPRRDQSGRSDPKLGISKCGNGFMRRLLVQGANYVIGPFGEECDLRTWALARIAEQGPKSKKKFRLAVARKLAVCMVSMWKNQRNWQPHPGTAAEAECSSATVGCDDCAPAPALPECVRFQIAASPTASIQPCTQPDDGMRTDESAESRRAPGKAAHPRKKVAKSAPVQVKTTPTPIVPDASSAPGKVALPTGSTTPMSARVRPGPPRLPRHGDRPGTTSADAPGCPQPDPKPLDNPKTGCPQPLGQPEDRLPTAPGARHNNRGHGSAVRPSAGSETRPSAGLKKQKEDHTKPAPLLDRTAAS